MIYRVNLNDGEVESVFLVTAPTSTAAKTSVLVSRYGDTGEVTTVSGYCKRYGCSIGATPFSADEPFLLYTVDQAGNVTA